MILLFMHQFYMVGLGEKKKNLQTGASLYGNLS